MSRNEKLLYLILQKAGRKVAKTRLLKLTYLADLLSWQVLGKPISDLCYIRYDHGPFDSDFYPAIEKLEDAGLIESEEFESPEGKKGISYFAKSDLNLDQEVTLGTLHIISHIVKEYEKRKTKEILDVVYNTNPMRGAKHNEVLQMEEEKNKIKDEFGGISLEQILQSKKEFAENRFSTFEELKKSILGSC